MYKVTLEGEDAVIRIKRNLMNQERFSRLLDLVNLEAVLEGGRLAAAKGKVLAGMVGLPTGAALLRDPVLNKDAAFTEEERDILGLRGLLPARSILTNAQDFLVILERGLSKRWCPSKT